MKLKLVAFDGHVFIEIAPNYLAYVEPLREFLERTPAEKDRKLRAAYALATTPSRTVH